MITRLLLFAFSLGTALALRAQDVSLATRLSAQVGNAVVFNNDNRGTSFGIGAIRPLGTRWEFRGDFEFARAAIQTNPAFDHIYDRLDDRAHTRSYALSTVLSYVIRAPRLARHEARVGLGLLGRIYDMRTVTDAHYLVSEDFFFRPQWVESATVDVVRRDVVNINALFSYRYRLTARWGLSAFGRYENPVLPTQERYGTISWGDARTSNVGRSDLFTEHQDGLRGWTYGLRLDWALKR